MFWRLNTGLRCWHGIPFGHILCDSEMYHKWTSTQLLNKRSGSEHPGGQTALWANMVWQEVESRRESLTLSLSPLSGSHRQQVLRREENRSSSLAGVQGPPSWLNELLHPDWTSSTHPELGRRDGKEQRRKEESASGTTRPKFEEFLWYSNNLWV